MSAMDWLSRQKPRFREAIASGLRAQDTALVKQQLLSELFELQKQFDLLAQQSSVDFSMLQTYREMIHSRRRYFDQLSR
jgi:hypothetical protein